MSCYFPQLEKAFHPALRMIGDKSVCIFVVGLDIFEGDRERLPNLFKRVSSLLNIKVCLSSHPKLIFEEFLNDDLGFSFKSSLTTIPAEFMSEIDCERISI